MLETEEWLMIRELRAEGLSISAIARDTGHSRNTVSKYLRRKEAPRYKPRPPRPGLLDEHKDYVKSRLDEYPHLSAVRLLEEIRQKGYTGGYTILKDYVQTIRKRVGVPAVYRFETKPGRQMQVDWFEVGRIDIDGRVRKIYSFTAVLGFSRMMYTDYTLSTDTATFIQCHLDAFRYFGGYTLEILYDNTKNVVLKRAMKLSETTWNPQFEDFFTRFGFIPRLCRPRRPQTKGKVENGGKYVKGNYIEGRAFDSLVALREGRWGWLQKANSRVHGTTREVPFERLKCEGLLKLDGMPEYVVYREATRKVSRDCYVSFESNRYSVPYKFASREALLRMREGRLRVLVDGELVCEHELLAGSHRVSRNPEHFKGLLKEILGQRNEGQGVKLRRLDLPAGGDVAVETRDLSVYERFATPNGGGVQ